MKRFYKLEDGRDEAEPTGGPRRPKGKAEPATRATPRALEADEEDGDEGDDAEYDPARGIGVADSSEDESSDVDDGLDSDVERELTDFELRTLVRRAGAGAADEGRLSVKAR